MGRPVVNRHKVGITQWRKWTNHAKKVFNRTYEYVKRQETINAHPKTTLLSRAPWHTVAWNAAWIAAEVADGNL
jgi:hypothetical protein